jgi:hypothetical protein
LRRMRIDLDDVIHSSPPVQDPIGPIRFTIASVAQGPKSEKYDFCGGNGLASQLADDRRTADYPPKSWELTGD